MSTPHTTEIAPPGRWTRHLAPLLLTIGLSAAALGLAAAPASATEPEVVGVIERDDQPGLALDARAKVDWGIVSGTVYFNIAETSSIANTAPYGGAMCATIGRLGTAGAVLGAACAIKAAEWVWMANVAKDRGQCLKIKFGAGYAGFPGQVYGGGYCTK